MPTGCSNPGKDAGMPAAQLESATSNVLAPTSAQVTVWRLFGDKGDGEAAEPISRAFELAPPAPGVALSSLCWIGAPRASKAASPPSAMSPLRADPRECL